MLSVVSRGYLIAYYVPIKFARMPKTASVIQSKKKYREALVTIELLKSSKIVPPESHLSEIYAPYTTNIARVVSCEPLNGDSASRFYLHCEPELTHSFTVNDIIRFKYSKLTPTERDNIKYYSTKQGALNTSKWVAPNTTGDVIRYYPSGKVRLKHYYINGCKTHTFGYRDDQYNSLQWTWTFYYDKIQQSEDPQELIHVREYLYDDKEKPLAQFVIADGKIVKSEIYDQTQLCESLYLKSSK